MKQRYEKTLSKTSLLGKLFVFGGKKFLSLRCDNGIEQTKPYKKMTTMKKSLSLLLSAMLLLGSCSYSQYSGLMAGASAGSLVGRSVGMLKGGPRGYDRGTVIGILAGAAAGAAITNAIENRNRKSFAGEGMPSYSRESLPLKVQNVSFRNEQGKKTSTLHRNEECILYFELKNVSRNDLYSVEPAIYEANNNQQIGFSPSTCLEYVGAGHVIRYSAVVKGMNRLRNGTAQLVISASVDGSNFVDLTDLTVATRK